MKLALLLNQKLKNKLLKFKKKVFHNYGASICRGVTFMYGYKCPSYV